MIMKIRGLGIKNYTRDLYNLFDGSLVIITMVDIVGKSLGANSFNAGFVQCFRVIRCLRVFKLARRFKGLVILLNAITDTLGSIFYFSILLVLFIFILSLVGR